MAKASLAQEERAKERIDEETRREFWRTVLRRSEVMYRHELLDMDEREILWDRIVRLRRRLGINA